MLSAYYFKFMLDKVCKSDLGEHVLKLMECLPLNHLSFAGVFEKWHQDPRNVPDILQKGSSWCCKSRFRETVISHCMEKWQVYKDNPCSGGTQPG